jgi:hypothetical protein
MKKILIVTDGKTFPKGAFEFVRQQQEFEPLFLTGLFLEYVNMHELLPGVYAMAPTPVTEFLEEESSEFKKNISLFNELCVRDNIEHTVHEHGEGWDIDAFVKETRFADLLVMSEELFYNDFNDKEPNAFMQQVIHRSECPVMLFPESFKSFDSIIITYDGKKDSLFALKEFCEMFPVFKDLPTKIVYIKQHDHDDIPNMVLAEEIAGRHFSNLDFEILEAAEKDYLKNRTDEFNNALIVSGSFGRSSLSRLFKKSFIKQAIQEHRHPLFIAHQS